MQLQKPPERKNRASEGAEANMTLTFSLITGLVLGCFLMMPLSQFFERDQVATAFAKAMGGGDRVSREYAAFNKKLRWEVALGDKPSERSALRQRQLDGVGDKTSPITTEEIGNIPVKTTATATATSTKKKSDSYSESDLRQLLATGKCRDCDLTGANLYGKDLSRAELQGSSLAGADLRHANLSEAILSGADLQGAKLSHSFMGQASLFEANLAGAELEGADMNLSDLSGAKMGKATLKGANLREAHLEGTVLVGADLEGADLEGADLEGADLTDADMHLANLHVANLQGVKGLP